MRPLTADDPRTIGEYRLQGRLGQGGMGRVYLGLSPAGRAVAIKVVHPSLASDAGFLRRFQREVDSARAVSGIYTAPVVATGLNENPPWLATAFVPGPSLEQMVADHGPLPESALWPLLGGLVEALRAIHACGVVHRDLKPANVLLAADGPRLIDFGISRAVDGTTLTATGTVFGTPGYMSPEQAEGNPVGPPSDVFALGCVIAFAATGAGPFGAGSAATVMYRVVHGEPALDGMPARLRDLVAPCLAKDPAARPSPQALASSIAGQTGAVSSSAVSFWPRPVADLIGAYQAGLGGTPDPVGPNGTRVTPGPMPAPPRGYPRAGTMPAPGGYPTAAPVPAPAAGGYPGYPAPAAGGYPAPAWDVYRQPYQGPPRPVSRTPRALPSTVQAAVGLMYAGAAHTLLLYGIVILTFNSIVDTYNNALLSTNQNYIPVQADRVRVEVVTPLVFVAVVQIALWLWMAWANRRGRNWARVTGTVLFGFYTIGSLGTVFRPGDGTSFIKLLAVVGWLIACATVVLLWQPQSSSFFRGRRP